MNVIANILGSAFRFFLRAVVYLLALAIKIIGTVLVMTSEELFKLVRK